MSEWMTINEFHKANRSSEEGLPDNHIITIRERVLTVDMPELIQNNVKTDTVTLELDSEWDGINPIIIFECSDENYQVAYTGEPVHIPQAVMLKIGRIGCSVCGLDDTGEIRLVTKAAPNIFTVMESGSYIGEVSDDDVSLLGQILAAADAANAAVDKVENASFTATATTLEPGESATAQITGDDLKMTVAFGIPKGEKGDKGDPGEQGIQGIPGVDGQDGQDGAPGADGFSPTVEVSKDGSVTTISITDKTGPKTAQINDGLQGPPGEKGDPGADGTNGKNGADGFSPTVEVSKSGTVTTISITDKTGVKTAEISDGAKGDKGEKGDPGQTPQRGVDYWTAEDVEAIVEDAKAQAVAELAEIGNIPKKTVTDRVAHGEDAYAQNPLEVRVKGKTVKNLWPAVERTQDGLTIATDETGLITVSGTATASGHTGAIVSGLAENKNVSAVKSGGTMIVQLQAWNAGSYVRDIMTVNTSASTANTGTGLDTVYARINYTNGETYNTSYRVMLVEGTEAPDCFTPTGVHGVYPEKLVVSGKNLLPSSELTTALNGNHTTDVVSIPPGTYTISCAQTTDHIIFRRQDGSDVFYDSHQSTKRTFELAVPEQGYFIFYKSESIAGDITNPQLELGSTATAYEPPTVTEVALPETDPLMYIYDRGDEMVIAQDGAVSVERQTFHEFYDGSQKYFDPIEADGFQYVALNSTKDRPSDANINMHAVISDRFATGKKAPGYIVLTTGSVSGDGRYYIAFLFCFEPGTFADADEARQWFADNPTNVWFAGMPETEQLGAVQLPQLPAPTFNQYHDSDVPSDTSTTYARDINIVLANLEAVQTALLGGE